MKAAIYARVSTQEQTCESQLRALREYAPRRGWSIACEYVDTRWSGAKASRPQLDRLMRDAALRKFDCVLVWKIDRFGRSVLHLNQQLAPLPATACGLSRRANRWIPIRQTLPAVYCSRSLLASRNSSVK